MQKKQKKQQKAFEKSISLRDVCVCVCVRERERLIDNK